MSALGRGLLKDVSKTISNKNDMIQVQPKRFQRKAFSAHFCSSLRRYELNIPPQALIGPPAFWVLKVSMEARPE